MTAQKQAFIARTTQKQANRKIKLLLDLLHPNPTQRRRPGAHRRFVAFKNSPLAFAFLPVSTPAKRSNPLPRMERAGVQGEGLDGDVVEGGRGGVAGLSLEHRVKGAAWWAGAWRTDRKGAPTRCGRSLEGSGRTQGEKGDRGNWENGIEGNYCTMEAYVGSRPRGNGGYR